MDLGRVGVWWSRSWTVAAEPSLDVAAELEALGYGALWSSGGFEPGLSPRFGRLLASTSRIAVASGIVSVWTSSPPEIAQAVAELDDAHPGRFVLGLGASHEVMVDRYERPYGQMVEYLDLLDGSEPTVPADRRVLAALGPRMLALAGARAAGAHPYFVPVEHTERAREILGTGPLLAPEVTVVLERDPTTARALAREFTTGYLGLPNYVQNLRTLGYDDDDVTGGGSDRLVDAVVAWGDVDAIVARVQEHHDAGADHVCLQVVSDAEGFPLREYRELAAGLFPG
jgi:probable F420-dependent oxidoreductase